MLLLKRIQKCDEGTFGVLMMQFQAPFALTLELPWHDNDRNVSCIPAGDYLMKPYRSVSRGLVYRVCGVIGRSGILFHTGNKIGHSKGCILVGDAFEEVRGTPFLSFSKRGLEQLRKKIGAVGSIKLRIKDCYHDAI